MAAEDSRRLGEPSSHGGSASGQSHASAGSERASALWQVHSASCKSVRSRSSRLPVSLLSKAPVRSCFKTPVHLGGVDAGLSRTARCQVPVWQRLQTQQVQRGESTTPRRRTAWLVLERSSRSQIELADDCWGRSRTARDGQHTKLREPLGKRRRIRYGRQPR